MNLEEESVCVDVSGFAEKKGRWKWHNYINHKILKKTTTAYGSGAHL